MRTSEHLVQVGTLPRGNVPTRRVVRMRPGSALRQFGSTQRDLLRVLLAHPRGATIEELRRDLHISYSAVRQHLATLMAQGFIARGAPVPSGGRPSAPYVLQPAGRELFPRNYELLARRMLEYLYGRFGTAAVQAMLVGLGTQLGRETAARGVVATNADAATRALVEQLDMLGYEARAVRRGDHDEVETHNCVFHELAVAHPDVCGFDLAFMRAATGCTVQRTQCVLCGDAVCRFRLTEPSPGLAHGAHPDPVPERPAPGIPEAVGFEPGRLSRAQVR